MAPKLFGLIGAFWADPPLLSPCIDVSEKLTELPWRFSSKLQLVAERVRSLLPLVLLETSLAGARILMTFLV